MKHGHIIPELKLASLAKQARLESGVTQAKAARQLGVSSSNISVTKGNWNRFTYTLADGYANLTIAISGGTGDADIDGIVFDARQ